MNRIGLVGWTMTVLAFFAATTAAQQEPTKGIDHKKHAEHLRACAKACSDCQRECDFCATHCAQMVSEGNKQHMTTLMTCQDCANVCAAAAHIVARGGPFATLICEPCAKACERCAKECERFPDDKHMKRCAEECRKCEQACREMVKHLSGSDAAGPARQLRNELDLRRR